MADGGKRGIFFLGIAVFLAALLCLALFIRKAGQKKEGLYISRAVAARMLTLLETDNLGAYGAGTEGAGEWYIKYIRYLYQNGDIPWDETYTQAQQAYGAFTYGELRSFLVVNGWNVKDLANYTDLRIDKEKAGKKVKKNDFEKIYDYLVLKSGNENGVVRKELTIIGTPSNMTAKQITEFGIWNCVALEGVFSFEGLSVDGYSDRTVCAYVRGNQIISVLTEVSDEICYPNIWITRGEGNSLTAYISGVYREFTVGDIEGSFTDTIGDIYMKAGRVSSLTVKNDTITGKVLKVGNDVIELEGYGNVRLEENFRVYKNYGVLEEKSLGDILVGYALADFVVADGQICAAVINKELTAKDIRVLIMDTGYQSLFHDRVTVSSQDGFTIQKGEEIIHVPAGELADIYPESEYMSEGRIILKAEGISNAITILSIERSYGNPYYSGTLEIACEGDKLVVINELPLEEYLYHVVPSEMPVGFGVEALKVQAVCARSYAYRHLLDNSYRMYGAHVDDSVNFQVYNNIEAQPDSTQAVKETYGQVITKHGAVVSAYYYSTSCGYMSDISLWSGNAEAYDMYVAKAVNPQETRLDLSKEENFKNFIYSENEGDFDYGFPFYRWNVELGLEYLTGRINEYLAVRYGAEPGNILTMTSDGEYVSVAPADGGAYVGELLSLEVAERSSGGAIKQLLIHGTKGDVLVRGELNIRYVLGPGDNLINTHTASQTTFYILPSAYMYPEEIYQEGALTGYRFVGGGYGHGIGMSQNAVSSMVKQGMRYDQIVEFFYDGVDIMNIYQ